MKRKSRVVISSSVVLEKRYPRRGIWLRSGTPVTTVLRFVVVRPPITTVRLSGTVIEVTNWFDARGGGMPGSMDLP